MVHSRLCCYQHGCYKQVGGTFSLVCMKLNVNGGVRTRVNACVRGCVWACLCDEFAIMIGIIIIDPG